MNPTPTQPQHSRDDERASERFADALGELLQARARSCGMIDIAIDVEGSVVAAEVLFTSDPDMGVIVDLASGDVRYGVLVGDDSQRWLDEAGVNIAGSVAAADDAAGAKLVLDGLLAARRPLRVRRDDG